jgi:hypothetical protein
MSTIFDLVVGALNSLNPPVPFAYGQLLIQDGSDFPDTFIVYIRVSASGYQYADNEETERYYRIQVSTFSRAGVVNLPDVESAMLAAGFVHLSTRDLPYDEITRHYGTATDYVYYLEV